MKHFTFALVLLLLTAQVGEAQVYEYKAYSWANYGSPFTYTPTSKGELRTAINGGFVPLGGEPTQGTLDDLFQIGQTSWSDDYDVGGGLHVSFSADAVYRPAEPLSIESPGIGAKVRAENNKNPGAATVIGESFVYLKHTVSISNPTTRDEYLKSFGVTTSLDGVIEASGDAIVLVGQAIRLTLDNGKSYTNSNMQLEVGGDINSPFNIHSYGRPGPTTDPAITLTNSGPYGTELIANEAHSMIVESLLYVRAQTGGLQRGAGLASADFSNTLRVSNIQFFDENDQVIPDLQVVGPDGAVYPYNVVPEPSTLALFGVGSMVVLLARFRRTRRC